MTREIDQEKQPVRQNQLLAAMERIHEGFGRFSAYVIDPLLPGPRMGDETTNNKDQ